MKTTFDFPGKIPKEVLEYFKEKRLLPSFDYRDVWKSEHDIAFTIAKMLESDLLGDMKKLIEAAFENGWDYNKWRDNAEEEMQRVGWWGKKEIIDPITGNLVNAQLGSPNRLKIIFETNIRTAYSAAQWERIQKNKEYFPYLLYTIGPSKEHRLQHAAWHGILLPADHPWWKEHFPPRGWGCKCRATQISEHRYVTLKNSTISAPAGEDTQIKEATGIPTGHVKGRVPVRTDAPMTRYQEWKNNRTGETEVLPEGVDPGWNYPPGQVQRKKKLLDLL